jgi:hypothetical protein
MRTRVRDLEGTSLSRVEEACGWLGRQGDPGTEPRADFRDDPTPRELAEMDREERSEGLAA